MKDQQSIPNMSKFYSFGKEDRNLSMNSNISQSCNLNNFDFNSLANRGAMELSKPNEINFENLYVVPNISNFTNNMMNKLAESSNIKKPTQNQIQLNLKFNSSPINFYPIPVQQYNINWVSTPINLNWERGKRIDIEMLDDSNIEIRIVDK